MDIAAFVASIAALLVAIWAVWYLRLAASVPGRSTQPRRHRVGRRRLVRARPETRFRLDHISRHRYVLRNEGTLTAYDVRVETGELSVHEGSPTLGYFPPGHTKAYLLIQPLQGRQNEITVRWRQRRGSLDEEVTRLPLDTDVTSAEDQGA